MTIEELLSMTPAVLTELTTELFRRGDETFRADGTSQESACFFLALRASSLLYSMGDLLGPESLDGFDTLARAHLESRDLLMTFRFDDQSARKKIAYWFAGKADNAWKAEHVKVEEFVTRLGAKEVDLGANWSKITAVSHPTKFAAQNSAVNVLYRLTGVDHTKAHYKRADYVLCLSRLIIAVTYELPGWISLRCDPARIPNVEPFHQLAEAIALPIVAAPPNPQLPEGSYRTPRRAS
jgi:hypothetical protein